jgi:HEPN domain-containing protein
MDRSSPIPEQLEVAELLVRHAKSDLMVARKIAPDPEIEDGPVGFHSQQAVEKSLKVALTLQGIDFPKTHDLDYLTALADEDVVGGISELPAVGWLTPWAAEFRYDDAPLEALDRNLAIAVAETAVSWAEDLIASASS